MQINKDNWCQNIRTVIGVFLIGVSCLFMLTACVRLSHQRLLYDTSDMQVGLSTDLSVDIEASPPIINKHPADFTREEIHTLLGALQVSGWSGAIVGVFAMPQPRPVFTDAELAALAEPLVAAFRVATLRERVFFVLQNPAARYDPDRTAGSIFFRDDYLHVVLTDHYAFLPADPGGGEKRDPRDTKGMKLWVTRPVQAATVPSAQEPRWNSFETVHISLKPVEVLAALKVPETAAESLRRQTPPLAPGQPDLKTGSSTPHTADPLEDLRSQMKEQAVTIQKLKAELEQLRKQAKSSKVKPSSRQQAPRKQPAP